MAARVRNWKALNAAHRQRGEIITVVFSPEGAGVFERPPHTGRPGAPRLYSDALIEALLLVKVMLRLPLRALQGFARGLAAIAGAGWPIPDYSTLCRRQARLEVALPAPPAQGQRRILMVDSTGLKVFGESEWKVRQHGADKRRTWRKVHLLVDRESGAIVAAETTDRRHGRLRGTASAAARSAGQHSRAGRRGLPLPKGLHRLVHAKGGHLLAPPPVNAQRWRPCSRQEAAAFAFRRAQLTPLQRLGRAEWKKRSGCSRRSYVEAMMHRLKALTGDRLAARTFERQKAEVRLRCKALNATATSTVKIAG